MRTPDPERPVGEEVMDGRGSAKAVIRSASPEIG